MHGFRWLERLISGVFQRQQTIEPQYMHITNDDPTQDRTKGGYSTPATKLRRNLIRYILAVSLFLNLTIPIVFYQRVIGQDAREGPFPPRQFEKITFLDITTAEHFSNDLLPQGAGWTVIDEPERYNLAPGILLNGRHNKYGVSWAHQYHCLRMLRDEFWAHVENRSTLIGLTLDDDPTIPDVVKLTHLDHCHGYLLQAILCNMDMTIEYPTGLGVSYGTIDGAGIAHTCTRRSVFDEYMAAHWPAEGEIEDTSNARPGEPSHDHGHMQ